jgi:hypothetical protein
MHARLLGLVTVSCLFTTAAASGQDGAKKAASGGSAGNVEVRFADGGAMRMTIGEEHLQLVTPHGTLKIAVADIRRLDLATRIPETTLRQIELLIIDLGSPQFNMREKAGAELLALAEKAYPAVVRAAQSSDAETAKRAKDLAAKIRARVPAQRLRIREKDVVYTTDSTISGRLELGHFAARTQQFGSVQLKLMDVASMYFLGDGADVELKLGGRYALNDEVWLDTQIEVTENGSITITATGEIDMYATGGYTGQYVGTPKGKKAWPGSNGLPYEPGTLIGRIGESGKVFTIKEHFEESAPATGRLYLRAAGNPYNVTTLGEYTIKIHGGVWSSTAKAIPDPPPDAPVPPRRGPKR